MKKWLKNYFGKHKCRHEWEHKLRIEEFAVLSGDRFDVICNKCGTIKESYVKKYNENGTGYF